MFGYVVVNKPELKIKEYDLYREYYCGLCHKLKEKYGTFSRLCLSYDYVFLILLLTGLYEPEDMRTQKRCVVHPVKEQNIRDNLFVDYAADMSVIFAKLKCDDDWTDEGNIIKKGYGKIINKDYLELKKKYPVKIELIEQCIMNIRDAELKNETNIDVIAGYFGKAFGEMCTIYEDHWEEYLRNTGFYLGKVIYILDAFDDLEKDIESNSYNPFKELSKDPQFVEKVGCFVKINAAECANRFEKLPIVENVEIIRNIIYAGIWNRFLDVKNRRYGNEESV